jgi:transcription termination factor Rho
VAEASASITVSASSDTRTGADFSSDAIPASPSTDGEVFSDSRDTGAAPHRPRHPRNGSYPAPRSVNPSAGEGPSSPENREGYSGPVRPDYAEDRPNNGGRPPRPERDRDRDYDDRAPGSGPGQGQGGPGMATGPDGEPRRLTKFERWKLRKEKFKQQKQQRYLERTGRAPQGPGAPGPNGRGPGEGPPGQSQGPGFNLDSRGPRDPRDPRENRDPRESRDPRDQQRDPRESRDPRNANGGEPRVWEPRPPRPEPVLGPPEDCEGLLEMQENKGFGFLRPKDRNFSASPQDPFVSAELVRQLGLRDGVYIEAVMRRGGRGPMVQEIKKVNGLEPNAYRLLPLFEELTAVNPNKRYILETEANRNTTRLIDFISPIGRGQRGLIVAPPRAGKTTFLQHIAEAMLQKYPEEKVIVLLVDERPEEVTELSRALPGAEIMASSNDQDPRNHIRMAHLAIERAKRLVEAGQHVFMLLDSITRLARGFNNAIRGGGGGKAMSGGLDSRALEAPRRLFAAARNTREAGSLTIMATALVETNNKGDDLIFQEFKGTGNMELVLDRKISQQYVYPAVDIFKSGTRREELLLPAHQLEKVHLIRRGLSGHRPVEAVERLLQVMGKYPTNNQMLIDIKSRE